MVKFIFLEIKKHKKAENFRLSSRLVVPGVGIEPTHLSTRV